MTRPSPEQERLAQGIWGDKRPPKRGYTQCCDCPAHFPTSGRKKRCSPCSDIHAETMARARCKAARA
jgi:hypothetical protein